ncbi:cupin domain-containing protein [Sphingomonas naphthae]|uniref:Cupin domain-containing protein n=1 Tax=Sphingomonas naphthae TaxID=1813468 RepID=A0ABY7TQS7_9SPHN|nr:cupin domain-containing protein [Sphingomonas naphthae]WCT74534.1 cupin domain-containing protein [Sphingomonas naphthae]
MTEGDIAIAPDARTGTLGKEQGFQFAETHAKEVRVMKGRRNWMEYLDYGVTDATNGRMRAQRIIVTGKTQGTGWHYHLCEMQFVYLFGGYIVFQLEDGRTLRLEAGDTVFIPGGFKHTEIDISEDFDCLEVSVPSNLGTVACDMPEIWRDRAVA